MMRWPIVPAGVLAILGSQNPPPRDASPSKTPAGTALISGIVQTASPRGEPARAARVTLSGPVARTATTDHGGRFTFGSLPAGRYVVQAYKPAYLTAAYGARWHGEEPVAIPLADGETQEIALRLTRGGVITGTLRDERGRPMPAVAVTALRSRYSPLTGERMAASEGRGVTSDDRGVYRIWGLPPGEYVVAAMPQFVQTSFTASDFEVLSSAGIDRLLAGATSRSRLGAPAPPPATKLPVSPTANYAPVFHPGAGDLSLASRIRLAASEERSGVDIAIRLVPTARIHGSLIVPAGVVPQSVTLELAPTGSDGLMLAGTAAARTKTRPAAPDGTFVIADVTPGTYRLLATTGIRAGRGAASAKGPPFWARAEVRVDGDDVPVAMELRPALTIQGRVVFDGAGNPPDATVLRFSLVPPGSGSNIGAGPPGGIVSADGRFVFTGVMPDSYRLIHRWDAFGVRARWMLRSAVVAGRDILDAPLAVDADSRDLALVVTLTDRVTELSGVFQDASGRPTTDYLVIVFPADPAARIGGSRRIRTARPGVDGTFEVVGLPPGDYLLAALADLETGIWNDPDFLAGIASSAIPISLREGERTRQDIRVR